MAGEHIAWQCRPGVASALILTPPWPQNLCKWLSLLGWLVLLPLLHGRSIINSYKYDKVGNRTEVEDWAGQDQQVYL